MDPGQREGERGGERERERGEGRGRGRGREGRGGRMSEEVRERERGTASTHVCTCSNQKGSFSWLEVRTYIILVHNSRTCRQYDVRTCTLILCLCM